MTLRDSWAKIEKGADRRISHLMCKPVYPALANNELLSLLASRCAQYRLAASRPFCRAQRPQPGVAPGARRISGFARCFPELDAPSAAAIFIANRCATPAVIRNASSSHACYLELARWSRSGPDHRLRHLPRLPDTGATARIMLLPHLGSWETLVIWLGRRMRRFDDTCTSGARTRAWTSSSSSCARAPAANAGTDQKTPVCASCMVGIKRGANAGHSAGSKVPAVTRPHRFDLLRLRCADHDPGTQPVQQGGMRRIYCYHLPQAPGRVRPAHRARLDARLWPATKSKPARLYERAIEQRPVRDYPEQYQWGYRRFKQRTVYANNRTRDNKQMLADSSTDITAISCSSRWPR